MARSSAAIVADWRDRLRGRLTRLARARRAHSLRPTSTTRAFVSKRRRQVEQARRVIARHTFDRRWGGCRGVSNEIVRIVNGRAPVTSRKRSKTYGNPGSDHHVSQKQADAVDFGIANAHWLKNEISRDMGGPRTLRDYGSFQVRRYGRTFRVQMIAGTHGTGPHLHAGIRRV